jgi:hypothetical protein
VQILLDRSVISKKDAKLLILGRSPEVELSPQSESKAYKKAYELYGKHVADRIRDRYRYVRELIKRDR